MAKKYSRKKSSRFTLSPSISRMVHGFGLGLYFAARLLPLVLAGFLVGGVYHGIQTLLYADPYFRLDVIRVKTDLPFSTKQIEQMSGLKLGQNLLAIDIAKVAKRIQQNPEIKRAEVVRVLPNTIEVNVARRFEVFQVKPKGQNRYFAIDDQGVILPKSGTQPLPGLVLVEDAAARSRAIGTGDIYPTPNLGIFKTLYQYVRQESELGGEQVEAMTLDHLGNYSIFLTGGFEVRLGKAYIKNLKKLKGLTHLLNSGERQKIEYLDLQYQDVVVKMRHDQQLTL